MNMPIVNFAAILRVFVLVFVAVTHVQASPLSLGAIAKRKPLDVFIPTIIQPTANTVWTAGAIETVIWDTSNAPPSISNKGHVVLQHVAHLAGPFDLKLGQVNVTVPKNLDYGGSYKIILFGDSGNESDEFRIVPGNSATPQTAPPASTGSEGSSSGSDSDFGV